MNKSQMDKLKKAYMQKIESMFAKYSNKGSGPLRVGMGGKTLGDMVVEMQASGSGAMKVPNDMGSGPLYVGRGKANKPKAKPKKKRQMSAKQKLRAERIKKLMKKGLTLGEASRFLKQNEHLLNK